MSTELDEQAEQETLEQQLLLSTIKTDPSSKSFTGCLQKANRRSPTGFRTCIKAWCFLMGTAVDVEEEVDLEDIGMLDIDNIGL
jgi:hypothetical protein